MKILNLPFSMIKYQTKTYDSSLKESLLRMGLGFPVYVKQSETAGYECVDGAKRLSAIADILHEVPEHKLNNVSVILINTARTPSGTAKNHH